MITNCKNGRGYFFKDTNKNKGFTLVELLAVIVILAVIAFITIPIVGNVVEGTRRESVKIGSNNYLRVLEQKVQLTLMKENLESNRYEIQSNGKYIYNGEEKTLDIKGSLPSTGTVCVDENGNVETYSLVIDGYVVSNTRGEEKIEKGDTPLSITCDVSKEIIEIKIPENSGVCSQTKTLEIIYPIYEEIAKEYSIDNRKTWIEYKEPIILKENGTIYARLRDTRNEKVSETASILITKIDNEKVTNVEPKLELSSENPTNQINVTLMQTDNCGIDESTIEYGISETKEGEYKYQKDNKFKNLKSDTTYYFKTKINDIAKNGIVESEIGSIKTTSLGICKIEVTDVGIWKSSKVVTISGETVKGTKLQYKIVSGIEVKQDWTTVNSGKTHKIDWEANTTNSTYIYCRYVDNDLEGNILNILNGLTLTETHIDITAPSLTLGTIVKTTKKITIPITASDNESGITSTTCNYGTSTSYGSTGTISNNTCTFSGNANTTYYYKVVTTNGSGLTKEVTGNTKTGTTAIAFTQTQYPTSTIYAQYKNATVTFSSSNVTSPVYYVKTTVATTSSVEGIACGTSTDPGTCSGSSTTSYAANTWYKVTSSPNIKFTANGSIYARVNDGAEYSSAETLTITKIDTTAPILTLGDPVKTTKKITIPITASDNESGITSTTCSYGTSTSYGSTGTISNNICTINGNLNTTYYYKVVTTNGSGLTKEVTGNTKTGTTAIAFSQTQYPEKTEYAQYKNATVTFTASNVTSPVYYVKTTVATTSSVGGIACGTSTDPGTCSGSSTTSYAANTWYKVTSSPNIKFTANGSIYARVNDGAEYSSAETLTITKIDTTTPYLTLGTIVKTTKKITIPITASDSESGITSTTCSYGTSTSYGSTGTVSNNTCTFSGNANTTYYYKVVTTNGSGLTKEVTGNTKTGTTAIAFTQTQYPTDTEYAQYKTVTITLSASNVTSPVYYVKTTVATTSTVGGIACGTETDPGTCSGSTTTSYEANTWYKVTSSPNIKFTSNGTVYARVNDGATYSSAETLTITKIDTTVPSSSLEVGTIKTDRVTLTGICSDAESGITKYEFSKDSGSTWDDNGTINTKIYTGLTQSKEYIFKVRCTNGSGLTKIADNTGTTSGIIAPSLITTSGWATSKVITVTYDGKGINSPVYYLKGTVAGTIGSAVTESCGTGTEPETCTSITNTTSLGANTWYKVSGSTILTVTSNGTIYAVTSDGTNKTISEDASLTIVTIDSTAPTTPTITYNGGANSCSWKNNYNITLSSTDNESGINRYEIDYDNNGTVDATTGANYIPANGIHYHYVRFRAVDNVGRVSEWTDVQHIHMDTGSPSTPSVTYNGGGNSCSWKNNYNLTLSSSDNIGIAYYEVDWDGDGASNTTTGSNFIPWNGYSSCGTRFRAVDHAGNRSGWTDNHHIHMDTQAPGKTTVNLNGYTSGSWTSSDVTQTASASDNVGIAYYQYSHDGVNVANFPNPWTINWNGQWNFYVRAIDHAGNIGAWSDMYTIRRGVYSASSVCGVASYNSCATSGCGVYLYNRCASAGVESYKTCANSACGVASYNSCQHANCGRESYSYSCKGTCYKYISNDTPSSCVARGGTPTNASGSSCTCKVPYSCTKTCTGTRNKTCANSACGVASYKSCATSGCGVNLYNRGSVCGVESYNTCANSACGVASYNTCWHT